MRCLVNVRNCRPFEKQNGKFRRWRLSWPISFFRRLGQDRRAEPCEMARYPKQKASCPGQVHFHEFLFRKELNHGRTGIDTDAQRRLSMRIVLLTVESFAGRADFQRIGALRPIGESPQKTREARKVFVDSCVFCGHIFNPWLRLCRAGSSVVNIPTTQRCSTKL